MQSAGDDFGDQSHAHEERVRQMRDGERDRPAQRDLGRAREDIDESSIGQAQQHIMPCRTPEHVRGARTDRDFLVRKCRGLLDFFHAL